MDRSRATDRDEVERFLATLAYVKVYGLFYSWFVLVLLCCGAPPFLFLLLFLTSLRVSGFVTSFLFLPSFHFLSCACHSPPT